MADSKKMNSSKHLSDLTSNFSINQEEAPVEVGLRNGMNQRRILRNLFISSFCYFLFYTGFWCLSSLQSTMNGAGGIGDDSQAVIYGMSLLSSLFLPDFLIARFGSKKVLTVCTLLGCPYLAANIYLRWDTMMVASVLYGLINGPFVTAQAVYIEEIASRFEKTINQNIEVVMACFFGFFGIFSESTNIFGNILVYYAFKPNTTDVVSTNSTGYDCGYHFKPGGNDTNSNLEPPPDSERLLLVGVFVALGIFAALILGFFLDPLGNDLKEGRGCNIIFNRFLSAVKHLKNPHQMLLIPIAIYMGVEGPFYSNEVTQAYIACSWGVHHVGFVTICFGVCGAIMSLLVGPLVKYISQMAVLILAACANIGICVLLFLWDPTPETTSIYFIIAGVWGMGDAIWWSQISALYGLMFPNDREAAFSNLYFWSFLGFFLSYSYANYLSVAVKINILMAFLLTGMACYLVGQIKIKCSARKEYIHIENGNQ
ncbi:protein unc-93 homolog A isoform X3 [Parasteatoda tepidariorum]|uniref:protein unc-93 homolog A isoform X3 n=1 Tax=Parasteatoda tepidariorum TaxID=114398 RepID=UPI001C72796C|nr:protein unc-93 homolog A isoform X3 [Parasteatoda tepidariorum]